MSKLKDASKFLAGLAAGALLFLPAGVVADRVIRTPETNPIYNVVTNYSRSGGADISVFDDLDNKCYVVTRAGADESDISCVKR